MVSLISSFAFTIMVSPACKSPNTSCLYTEELPVLTLIFFILLLIILRTYRPSVEVTTAEGRYVLKIINSKIKKISVSTGNSSVYRHEVFGDLQAGDTIIVNANDEIKETM